MINNVHFRSSTLEDLPFVIKEEKQAAAKGFVANWSLEEHQAGIERETTKHMIVEYNNKPVGYVIMNQDEHDNLEIMRLVISEKHKGYGRQSLNMIKKIAFEELHCNRLWLDVRAHNRYAINVYQSMGFVEEGILRQAVKLTDGYVSVIIFSVLRSEYDV